MAKMSQRQDEMTYHAWSDIMCICLLPGILKREAQCSGSDSEPGEAKPHAKLLIHRHLGLLMDMATGIGVTRKSRGRVRGHSAPPTTAAAAMSFASSPVLYERLGI